MRETSLFTMIGHGSVAKLLPLLLVLCHQSWGRVSDGISMEFSEGQSVALSPQDSEVRFVAPDNKENHHDTGTKTLNFDLTFEGSEGILASSSSRSDFPCPLSTAIAPCVCLVNSNGYITLDCTDVEYEDQLTAVFQQEFPVKEISSFYMTSNTDLKILVGIENGVSFESIYLAEGPYSLQAVSEYFLLPSRLTLRSLQIVLSELLSDTFPFVVLNAMEKLEELSIRLSSFTWIPKLSSPMLRYLELSQGIISNIEPGTFDGLPNLQFLVLAGNSLTELKAGTIPIREGPIQLYGYNNDLQIINPGTFFFYDTNSTNSNEEIYINLSPNKIQALEAGTFPLRNGPMTIYLSRNEIASIEPRTFVLPEATDSLTIDLELNTNQLTTVDEAVFGDLMPFITTLYLNSNPLSCGCDIAWLVLNSDYMAKVDEDATCAEGTNLQYLKPEDYVNFC